MDCAEGNHDSLCKAPSSRQRRACKGISNLQDPRNQEILVQGQEVLEPSDKYFLSNRIARDSNRAQVPPADLSTPVKTGCQNGRFKAPSKHLCHILVSHHEIMV
eukprot:745836-Hanusia_phi.AAC.1